jgi:leucyl aminopeptidase
MPTLSWVLSGTGKPVQHTILLAYARADPFLHPHFCSCGADSYVADEVITSHAGVRVSVGNTDAEGRMVLADCLSHCREKALTGRSFPHCFVPRLLAAADASTHLSLQQQTVTGVVPRLMSVCTLTGHAVVSVGPYGITLDNSVAKRDGQSYALQAHGEVWGDPLEVRTSKHAATLFLAGPKSRPAL